MHGRRSIIARVVGILTIGLVIPHVLMPQLSEFGMDNYNWQISISILTTALMWEGNLFIVLKLQERIPWQTNSFRRLIIQLFISGIYSNLVVFATVYVVCFVLKLQEFRWDMVMYHLVLATILVIMVSAIYEGSYFLSEWKRALSKAERLEKENIITKYEALKNQVNPHFLFNSLNTLSSMVMDEENGKAVDFINKLSTVYRYILQSKNKDLVDLRTEIKIVEEYVFLLKNRFEDSLDVKIDIPEELHQSVIPPLTIQMLVENAVKHNVVSTTHPLKIHISIHKGNIEIKNTLFLKQAEEGKNTGSGLENIKSRYQLLSKEKVFISQDDQYYIVSLPLLKLVEKNENESINNRRRSSRCKKIN